MAAAVLVPLVLAGSSLAEPDAAGDGQEPPLIPCTGRYALCTSAPCAPVPGAEIEVDGVTGPASLCECEVIYGANVAFSSCADRAHGARLLSTYSYAQTGALKLMTCKDAVRFTNCLDAPCLVDPKDPSRALCTCPIAKQTEPWVTFGGGCDPAACATTLWSAATVQAITGANCVLNEYMGLSEEEGTFPGTEDPACDGPYESCGE